jgi:hypothetical protein
VDVDGESNPEMWRGSFGFFYSWSKIGIFSEMLESELGQPLRSITTNRLE